MFEQDSLERDAATAFAVAGGLPVAAYLKKKYTDNLSDSFAKYGRALPGSEYLDDQINLNGAAKLSSSANSFQKSILSALMAIEEMSPLHILRTLQLSNLIQPFTELTSNNELVHFSGRQIRGQEAFYRALLNQAEHDKNVKIKRTLQLQDLSRGMFYLNGSIYGATKSGTIDMNDKILSNAKLVLGSLTNGDIQSSNHIVEKLGDIIGGKVDKSFAASSPLMFVGGPSESVFAKQWGKSALRYSMEVGFKTLDNPVAGIEEMLHGVGAGHLGLFKSKPWQKLREISSHVQLGTNGIYDLGIRESLKLSAKNIAIKSSAAYIGYEVLDSALRSISPQGGIFENGIATGMANLYANARVNFAKVWSDRFQGYKEKQEQAAPGSTSLTTLMAFPLGGALAGAQLGYFGRVGLASAKGIEKSAEVFNVESQSKLLSGVGLTEKFKPMKRNALVGGLIGGALTLPFLPGALIGESSEELKALYSGKKDVLDRKNKFWTFGGQCMPSNQPIYTKAGLKLAGSVIEGDELLDRFGNYNKVTKLFQREVDETIYNIKVSGGLCLDNKFTKDHPILTTRGWIKASEITSKDVLIAPKFKIESCSSISLLGLLPRTICVDDLLYNTQKDRNNKNDIIIKNRSINKELQLSRELGLVFGWFLAEGHTTHKDLSFSFHESEINFAKFIGDYLKTTFNINYKIRNVKGKSYELRVVSRLLVKVFKLFFYNSPEDNFKKFPTLNNTNEDFIKGFLIGLYYGDGNLAIDSKTKKRSIVRLSTAKLDHVLGLKNLLTYFEIYPYIIEENRQVILPNGDKIYSKIYRVVCEGAQAAKLCKSIGIYKELYKYEENLPIKNTKPNYWFDSNFLYVKVKECSKEVYKGFVHDYTVENSHEFQVTSFIVHNSWEGQAPDRFKKHWVAQANTDAVDKVRYGDDETKKKMNPFLRPFSYLKDPYQFEKRNAESMPYPVWGMDVSYGGIFGKAFEKTIGKVIKPDIINPALYDSIEETQSKTTIYNKSLNFLAARREFGSTVENSVKESIKELGSETVTLPNNVHARDRGLMIDGLMKVPQKPGYDPNLEAGMLTYQSFVDFAGIKGWTSSLAVGSLGLAPDVSNQLARSGEASSAARDLQDMNLGDLMGLGEFQRKILPTSAGAQPDRLNPIRNNSPSWLPNDPSKFYLDFSRGNPYSKIAMGEERLAGVGFCFHPDTDIITPEGYKKISNIQTGDYVWTSVGFKKVLNTFKRQVEENLISIATYGGQTSSILVTKQHEIKAIKISQCKYKQSERENKSRSPCKKETNFCKNLKCTDYIDNQIEWIEASKLEEGDYVTKPVSNYTSPGILIDFEQYVTKLNLMKVGDSYYYTNHLKDKIRRGKIAKIPEIIQDKSFWFVVGLWVAEGNLKFSSCSKNKSVIGLDFCFHKEETYLVALVSEVFGEYCTTTKIVGNTLRVHVRNRIIGEAFYDYFGSAKLKKLPSSLSKEQFISLFSGWLQGDGHLTKESFNLTIGSCYRTLLNNLITYLELFNINYSRSKHGTRPCYNLRILASSSYLFTLLDYKNKERSNIKTISDFILEDHRCFKIRSIKEVYYEGFVYDIEVEDIHEYCTSNFIAHNSALNPEVSGVDPDDYSLVYKHKILADVARGSGEHQEHRAQAIEAYRKGKLSRRETEILGETLHREEVLQQKKEFYEGPSRIGRNLVNIPQSVLWEKMRSNSESPLEMLTPLRPVAKFLHQRTAIEDYIETQLGGSDAAIWTNPYSHFIKPTANKIRQTFELSGNFIPQETREKYNIDEYFDKLDYLRKRKQGSDSYSLTTVIGSSMSGLNTKEKVLKFRGSLTDDQKDYFHSFSNETDQKKRNMIRALLPDDVRRGYEQIWSNLDTAKEAKKSGGSVQKALLHKMDEQTKRLRSVYDVSLEREDKKKARDLVHKNKDNYVGVGMRTSARIQATENEILRAKMADIEALSYVEKRTGVPSKNFVGWDPRIKTDDIKIKTLSIGGEDLRRFGFWQKDEERMRSLEALSKESDQVFTQIESIKANIRSDRALKMGIERTMFEKGGFKASNIQFVDRDFGGILVKDNSN